MLSNKGEFDKIEFLAKFQDMRTPTFKKPTIQSILKRTGLIFYNFEVVLKQVCVFSSLTWVITLPPPDPTYKISLVYIPTSHCSHEIKNQAIILITSMKKDQRLVHSKFQSYLD